MNTKLSVPSLIAGVMLGALLAGGGAFAAGQITGAQIKNNTVTTKDIKNSTVKGRDVKDGSITAADIATNGVASAEVKDFGLSNQDIGVLFAEVNSDGALANSSGGVTSENLAEGSYRVDFGRDISACAKIANTGSALNSGWTGEASAVDGTTPQSALVTTYISNGNLNSRPFKVIVVC